MSYVIGKVIELDYNELVVDSKDFSSEIETAFGNDGVGVLTVKNVPGFVEARAKLLPISRKFATLPNEIKDKYVHKESFYSFGWSHGKEKLQGNFGKISLFSFLVFIHCLLVAFFSLAPFGLILFFLVCSSVYGKRLV
jgi:hypothetical protein